MRKRRPVGNLANIANEERVEAIRKMEKPQGILRLPWALSCIGRRNMGPDGVILCAGILSHVCHVSNPMVAWVAANVKPRDR